MTITVEEDLTHNNVYIDNTALETLVEFGERAIVYEPSEPVDKRGDRFDEWGGLITLEEFADTLPKYAVYCIVPRVGKGGDFRYVVSW